MVVEGLFSPLDQDHASGIYPKSYAVRLARSESPISVGEVRWAIAHTGCS